MYYPKCGQDLLFPVYCNLSFYLDVIWILLRKKIKPEGEER